MSAEDLLRANGIQRNIASEAFLHAGRHQIKDTRLIPLPRSCRFRRDACVDPHPLSLSGGRKLFSIVHTTLEIWPL